MCDASNAHKPNNKTYTTTVEYDEEEGISYPHHFVEESYGGNKLFIVFLFCTAIVT